MISVDLDFPELSKGPKRDGFTMYFVDQTSAAEMEGGYSVSRPRNSRRLHGWRLAYELTQDDVDALTAFVDEQSMGTAMPFNWENPTTLNDHIVKFKSLPEYKYICVDSVVGAWYEVVFEIEEF